MYIPMCNGHEAGCGKSLVDVIIDDASIYVQRQIGIHFLRRLDREVKYSRE